MPKTDDFTANDHKFFLTNSAQLQRWLPWLRMFLGFRIAIDYQKMLVSFLAVLIWLAGSLFCSELFLRDAEIEQLDSHRVRSFSALEWLRPRTWETSSSASTHRPETTRLQVLNRISANSQTVVWPVERVGRSLAALITERSPTPWWHHWCQLIWGLTVTAFFGVSISRMTARELTGNGRSLIRDTRYALRQFPITICAPLIVLLGFAALWTLNSLSGWVGRMPVIGESLLAVFWLCFLFIALLMALLFVGLLLGWPLMYASNAVERNDAFDAVSRSLSYLLNRTWYAFFLAFIAVLYGSVLLIFVTWMTQLTATLSINSIASGAGIERPAIELGRLSLSGRVWEEMFQDGIARMLFQIWGSCLSLIPMAFSFSFFWSSTTIGYFLLRRSEDGTPLDEMNLSDSTDKNHADLPLVGIPAAEYREAQRRHSQTHS